MKKEHEDVISRILGIQPISINSALVSAQNRERLYWTNIATVKHGLFDDAVCSIPQPKDRGIYLKDILQPESEVDEKYYISDVALARILRTKYSKAQFDPEKTGTINTKNNSGQLSVDSGTTLITEVGQGRTQAFDQSGKVPPLRAHDGCSHDNRVCVVQDMNNFREIVNNKSTCIDANYFKGLDNHGARTGVKVPQSQADRIYDTDDKSVTIGTIRLHGDNSEGLRIAKDGKCPTLTIKNEQSTSGTIVVGVKQVIQLNEANETGAGPQSQNRVYSPDGISPALLAGMSSGTHAIEVHERIRRLTIIEVCRLQNVDDDYFFYPEDYVPEKGKQYTYMYNGKLRYQIVSDSAIYKQIGNGWTIDVIAYILSFIPKSQIDNTR